ncbi:SDR family NAD(P)-dependent oxidoreductase [Chloroflexota bacterium]
MREIKGARLKNKVAIITGGAQGIGHAYVTGFAKEGAKLVIADINLEVANANVETFKKEGTEVLVLKIDVSSLQDTQRMAKETAERFGRIDILVNDAAIFSLDGTKTGANQPIETTDGLVGDAQDFDGSNSISLGADPWMAAELAEDCVEVVFLNDTPGGDNRRPYSIEDDVTARWKSATHLLAFYIDDGAIEANNTGALAGDTWYYHGASWDGTDVFYQKDTTQYTGTSGSPDLTGGANFRIGATSAGGERWGGKITELRVSDIPRSQAWRDATYYTVHDDLITFSTGIDIISFTVTDYDNNGIQFGSVNPGVPDQPADQTSIQGAVTLTVKKETDVNVNVQFRSDNLIGPSTNIIPVENVKYNSTNSTTGVKTLTTSYDTWYTVIHKELIRIGKICYSLPRVPTPPELLPEERGLRT